VPIVPDQGVRRRNASVGPGLSGSGQGTAAAAAPGGAAFRAESLERGQLEARDHHAPVRAARASPGPWSRWC
jgi:hypothetical protein